MPSAVEPCGAPGDTDTARGHVFEDTNGNGVQDAGEPGLAGVPVSNGCEVSVTDADGAYEVPVAPGQILFMTKPSGYAVPVDEHNVAQFFYRHYLVGTAGTVEGASVAWRFPVVEATGPLPAAVDFPLFRWKRRLTGSSTRWRAWPAYSSDRRRSCLRSGSSSHQGSMHERSDTRSRSSSSQRSSLSPVGLSR